MMHSTAQAKLSSRVSLSRAARSRNVRATSFDARAGAGAIELASVPGVRSPAHAMIERGRPCLEERNCFCLSLDQPPIKCRQVCFESRGLSLGCLKHSQFWGFGGKRLDCSKQSSLV